MVFKYLYYFIYIFIEIRTSRGLYYKNKPKHKSASNIAGTNWYISIESRIEQELATARCTFS